MYYPILESTIDFTNEIENYKTLPFLAILLIMNNNELEF